MTEVAAPPRVRAATSDDVAGVADGIERLLVELGGGRPDRAELEAAARELVEDPRLGALLVAESEDGRIVGVCATSWQHAVHVPGRYGTLQDLWVDPEWRSRAVGRAASTSRVEAARSSVRLAVTRTGALTFEEGEPLGEDPILVGQP